MRLAIIGGTGVYGLADARDADPKHIVTGYGEAQVRRAAIAGHEVVFLERHGAGHRIPPHRVNYRANIAALKALDCTAVIATNAVGSLRRDLLPGTLVAADQFLDFTKSRPLTFFDGDDEQGVKHADVTEPYCPSVRRWLIAGASEVGETCVDGGTYLCAEGPRFETAAEIRLFAQWGADMVGMTGVPEVVLAREVGLCYATLCLVTNLGAGLSDEHPSHREVTELMDRRLQVVEAVLLAAVSRAEDLPHCSCRKPIA
ncbi:MAG: S-methyl-5'-thioinosine phosphorylase [Armatimonadetes bacterium]|nr:S-methyl-5'-thioinosine phosphorylase [Armatimonadota bacterium]